LLALLSIYWSLAGVLRSIFTGEGHDQIENDVPMLKNGNGIVGEIASITEDSSPTERLLQTAYISTDIDTTDDLKIMIMMQA